METGGQVSQQTRRPFRWRRKQLASVGHHEHCYQEHLHPHPNHEQRQQQQQQEQIASNIPSATSSRLPSAIDHHHSPATAASAKLSCRAASTRPTSHNHRYSSPKAFALFMYLSIVACVTMSLLNLTPSMGLRPALAAAGSSQATNQAAMSQQQSNSVIQYPATTTTTTTAVKARYKTMYACEDRQLAMDCENGSKINLIRANFGRFSITQCNEQGQLDLQTDCMSPITFRIMQEKCQDKQRCSVNATSLIFGDKCPKTRKYLEVHFQCQTIEPDAIDLRNQFASGASGSNQAQPPLSSMGSGQLKPPNNPTPTPRTSPFATSVRPSYPSSNYQEELFSSQAPSNELATSAKNNQQQPMQPSQQLPTAVINSPLMSSVNAINTLDPLTNKLETENRGPIIISMPHLQVENMSRPRCHQWDGMANQWTERGARMLDTNHTHTICAFDQTTAYVLVMDYSGPMQTISPINPSNRQPSANPIFNSPPPNILESQPIPLESYPLQQQQQQIPFLPPNQFDINHPPVSNNQQQQQQQQSTSTKLFSLFGYLLAAIVVVMGLITLTFVASSMRSSAGAALKSLGNFAPFNGPKYNKRRQGHQGPASLHSNKDLLVINNSNGHQFIYAPASSTKISSSPSTHILSASQPGGLAGQHQGTLHRLQQQQMYSGNGATLSSLSGTGAQSNNYYYGLMGLNPLFQQQQSHHFSQHHLNQQQQQQQQQHQAQIAANYSHQANKSTVSAESANSSSSSSGVESSSTSMQQQQQQQQQTQQACLVSTSGNQNDFNLMGGHISSNYGHLQQQQQQNMFAHSQQPGALTLNAHYSTSGGVQSINMSPAMHARQASAQLRDHIYECVDDDKPYMARLLMPSNNEQLQQQQQQFGTLGHQQFGQQAGDNSRAMTLSSRLLQDVFQQQQQAQNCGGVVRRNFPQTAIVRDQQAAKTNIICSKLALVAPQRATEIGSKSSQQQQQPQQFAHTDVMAIYNKDDATTMTTAHQQPTSTNNSCYGQRLDTNMSLNNQGKLSTDC